MFDGINGIIWDYNGTLLNDTELSVQTMNEMLLKRNLQQLTVSIYKDVFTFPVKEYYQKIGFDFQAEPFEIPAIEYIGIYKNKVHHCSLYDHMLSVLKYFKSLSIKQFILSAMEQDALVKLLKLQQIDQYFDHVSGLDNHYAASKLENGKQLISTLNLDVNHVLLIGDTVHDYEVAKELGCKCVLIANGHQSRPILEATGALVIDEIKNLLPGTC